ncbi:MAG: hypothetical protein ACR2HR_02490 [Euzebya sp.]
MPIALAHALPQSVGAVPLTVILTLLIGLFLAVDAVSGRRARSLIRARSATTRPPQPDPDPAPANAVEEPQHATGMTLGLAGLVAIVLLATFGPADPAENLTDRFVLTLLWGFVGISSIILGSWWWRVDPLRGLNRGLAIATGDPDQRSVSPLSPTLATSAAITGLLAWAYVQLFVTASVLTFQLLLIAYLAVHLIGTSRYGSDWLRRTESLTVLSDTLGMARPSTTNATTNATTSLITIPDSDRLRWICGTLIGWSLVDLVIETEWWHDLALTGATKTWLGTGLLLIAVAAICLLIRAVSGTGLGPAFVSVAAGWVVAHYLSLLMIEGQGIPIWLSDPFSTGANYLGRSGSLINLQPVGVDVLAVAQAIPFVAGHLAAVVILDRRAATVLNDPRYLGPTTFLARAVIAVALIGGTYLQLGGL